MGAIGSLLGIIDKVLGRIPKRIESIKNKIDKLEKERSEIYIHKAQADKARRLDVINARLKLLNDELSNAAQDT